MTLKGVVFVASGGDTANQLFATFEFDQIADIEGAIETDQHAGKIVLDNVAKRKPDWLRRGERIALSGR